MVRRAVLLVLVATFGACKFPALDPIEDDAAPADGPMPDAARSCVAETLTCDDAADVYVECSASGTVIRQISCALGCDDVEEKCVDIAPTNDLGLHLDMARDLVESPVVVFEGTSLINANGTVFNGGESITVPMADHAGMRVLMFRQLTVGAGASLMVGAGAETMGPLVLLSDGPVLIEGVIDVSSGRDRTGPGICGVAAGEGGDAIVGIGTPAPGGGGGGGGSTGAAGGSAGGTQGGSAGSDGFTGHSPLVGGCDGGFSVTGNSFAQGGRGGGGLQIVSRSSITLMGSGTIAASGGGGLSAGPSLMGGSGGGSGGIVFLEAPQIILDGPSVTVAAKGGGGAAAGTGSAAHQGSDGGYGPGPAAGGVNGSEAAGGRGGYWDESASLPAMAGGSGASGKPGAGGGGGAGLARFHTLTGTINPQNGATIRAVRETGMIATRLVP